MADCESSKDSLDAICTEVDGSLVRLGVIR